MCCPKKREIPSHARVVLGRFASSVAGQCRRRHMRSSSSNRLTFSPVRVQKQQQGLSVMSGHRSLSRCRTPTRRNSGADLKFPEYRKSWSSRIGGARSMPLGFIILLFEKGGGFEQNSFFSSFSSSSLSSPSSTFLRTS
jgi:hypothetical protein